MQLNTRQPYVKVYAHDSKYNHFFQGMFKNLNSRENLRNRLRLNHYILTSRQPENFASNKEKYNFLLKMFETGV